MRSNPYGSVSSMAENMHPMLAVAMTYAHPTAFITRHEARSPRTSHLQKGRQGRRKEGERRRKNEEDQDLCVTPYIDGRAASLDGYTKDTCAMERGLTSENVR